MCTVRVCLSLHCTAVVAVACDGTLVRVHFAAVGAMGSNALGPPYGFTPCGHSRAWLQHEAQPCVGPCNQYGWVADLLPNRWASWGCVPLGLSCSCFRPLFRGTCRPCPALVCVPHRPYVCMHPSDHLTLIDLTHPLPMGAWVDRHDHVPQCTQHNSVCASCRPVPSVPCLSV
jgi:hypothetical protein